MTKKKPYLDVYEGMVDILFCHIVNAAIVTLLSFPLYQLNIVSSTDDPYFFVAVWVLGWTGIGISQFLYVFPIYLSLRKQQKLEKAKGVIITAIITLLSSRACFINIFS